MADVDQQESESLQAAIAHALSVADSQDKTLIAAMLSDALYFAKGGGEYAWSTDSGKMSNYAEGAFRFAHNIKRLRAREN